MSSHPDFYKRHVRFKSQFWGVFTVWPVASHFTSLSLGFLIYK